MALPRLLGRISARKLEVLSHGNVHSSRCDGLGLLRVGMGRDSPDSHCQVEVVVMNPHDDFLVSMFQDDPRLVEMFREAERKRKKPDVNWYAVIGLGMMIASATLVIWCFAKVLDTL